MVRSGSHPFRSGKEAHFFGAAYKMDGHADHVLLAMGVFDARVCSSGTYEDALYWIRSRHPSGTAGNWQKHDEGKFAPIPCSDDRQRTHYMFSC